MTRGDVDTGWGRGYTVCRFRGGSRLLRLRWDKSAVRQI